MRAKEALGILRVKRVVWVDDIFNRDPPHLADMLLNASDVALECKFADIEDILKRKPYAGEELRTELAERLEELGEARSNEIRTQFFQKEAAQKMLATPELTDPAIQRVCTLLDIKEKDRWNFTEGFEKVPQLCKGGDADVAYIIDLSEAGKSSTQGLELLKGLHVGGSEGVAFILTHEADENGEVAKETDLRSRLVADGNNGLAIPICVIAKARLLRPESDREVEENLKVAVKRAAIQRDMAAVVSSSKDVVATAYEEAAKALLAVPPEHLEEYVVERGYKEGVSELHVVERILTSQISQRLRMHFGTSKDILDSASRLRELREIKLATVGGEADPRLADFRLAEVWESEDLINSALAPIACGDVFATDEFESVPGKSRKFVLLAQPCDIALRPEGKSRARETGILVPLKMLNDPSEARRDELVLPCKVDGKYWECDFHCSSSVRLDILDLASYRNDGRVRLDLDHVAPKDLIASQSRVYEKRTASATKALQTGQYVSDGRSNHPSLQLAFAWEDDFKQYYAATLSPPVAANPAKNIPALPKRIGWRLRRVGRVRAPYAVALLDHYLSGMGRHAFDMDYMSPGQKAPAKKPEELASPESVPEPPKPVERK